MKKTLLCFILLFTNLFYAQVSNIEHCGEDTSFDLTTRNSELIGNLNPAETTVSYHLSLNDANNNANVISNPSKYISTASSKTIYARIDNKGTITTNYFSIIVYSHFSTVATIEGITCTNNKGSITATGIDGKYPYQYSLNGEAFSSTNVFNDLTAGTYVIATRDALGCESSIVALIAPLQQLVVDVASTDVRCFGMKDGSITINTVGGNFPFTYFLKNNSGLIIRSQPSNTFSDLDAGLYIIEVSDSGGCMVAMQIEIKQPTLLIADIKIENKTITIAPTGGSGSYEFSVQGLPFQSSPIITVPVYGYYDVMIRDENGCYILINTSIEPPAPLLDGKNEFTFEFTPGQTLGDLNIEGQNIKWYGTKNSLNGKTSKTEETTLPLTTVLADGTKYYASQTIDGFESTKRLAVTAKLKGSLSTPDFALLNLKYYPNPVQHILSVNNTSNIDEVEIISISGKSILTKKINNINSEIDLSNLTSGFYFLKVKSEGTAKTIKIVKK